MVAVEWCFVAAEWMYVHLVGLQNIRVSKYATLANGNVVRNHFSARKLIC